MYDHRAHDNVGRTKALSGFILANIRCRHMNAHETERLEGGRAFSSPIVSQVNPSVPLSPKATTIS